jgi:hypothetical protein
MKHNPPFPNPFEMCEQCPDSRKTYSPLVLRRGYDVDAFIMWEIPTTEFRIVERFLYAFLMQYLNYLVWNKHAAPLSSMSATV